MVVVQSLTLYYNLCRVFDGKHGGTVAYLVSHSEDSRIFQFNSHFLTLTHRRAIVLIVKLPTCCKFDVIL